MSDCGLNGWERARADSIAACFQEDSPEKCRNDVNWNFLGNGKTRFVYEHPTNSDCVVKFDTNRSGNKREVEVSQEAPEEVQKWIPSIIDHADDYRWVTMKRMSQGPGIGVPRDRVDDFHTEIEEVGWECIDGDVNNFGYRDGEWWLYDYASCREK